MLTFNPGWSGPHQPMAAFTDVRSLCQTLEANGVTPVAKKLDGDAGPAYFTLEDPDGNPILIDQHV